MLLARGSRVKPRGAGLQCARGSSEREPFRSRTALLTFFRAVPARAVAVRAATALAAAAAFALPLLAALHTPVPGTRQAALFEPGQTDRLVPFEIHAAASADPRARTQVHTTPLVVRDAAALTSHQRILLMVGTYRTVPHLVRGELSFAGMDCAYHAAGGAEIADNYLVAFERAADCPPAGDRATGRATLALHLGNAARIALWTYLSDAPPPGPALVLASPGTAEARIEPILVGTTVDVHPADSATRIDLLAYMWDVRATSRWIDAVIASGGIMIGLAVTLAWPAPRLGAARQTAAAFLAALALGGAYAVVCPPFQVADEPSHFQVLAGYLGRPELARQSDEWARRAMFEEIRFHPSRPFSPLDRGHSGRAPSLVSLPTRDLHGAARVVWRPLGALVRGMDLPHVFLAIRLFQAAVFAAAVALSVLLVRVCTGSAAAAIATVPLFLVPSLPQFGMHVSNYAPLLAAYTLIGAGLVIASWDGPRSWAAGPILGVGLGAAIGMSRSTLPFLPMAALVLAARAVLGDRAGRRAAAWIFWAGFTLSLAGMLTLLQRGYTSELEIYGGLVAAPATAFLVLLQRPLLLLPFGAAGLMAELLLTRARAAVAWRPAPAVVRAIALAAALGLFVLFAASLFVPYPVLPLYAVPQRPPALVYVRQAVLACGTFLRFGRPDWLTSVTFFAGFGWLDFVPPVRLVSILAGASGLALLALLVWIARAGSRRALIWLGCAGAGFVVSAAAYALSIVRAVSSDLHGRYLLGLYVCALIICWTGPARAADSPSSGRYAPLAAAALAGCIAVNVYCLRLILLRYLS